MPLSIDTFQSLAESSWFSSRDIVVKGEDEAQRLKLGNLVFSSGAKVNDATMRAFKAALEAKYGVFGTHAFDTVVGTRMQTHKSLRACDVKATLSQLETVKKYRFIGEMNRQLRVSPKVNELAPLVRKELRQLLHDNPMGDPPVFLENCRTQERLEQLVDDLIDLTTATAIRNVAARHGDTGGVQLGVREELEAPVAPDEPVGLKGLTATAVYARHTTSVEDRVKGGFLGAGMRINRSGANPVLLEKLKTNGVEPGFITRNDWSIDDTRGLLADIWSPESRMTLEALIARCPSLQARAEANPPASRRELIMLAGRMHPAGVAAVAEFVLERDLAQPDSAIAKAFRAKFPSIDPKTIIPPGGNAPTPEQKTLITRVKRALFIEIRNAVMNEPTDSDDYDKSPIFKHFADRSIVKLDYNEGDRLKQLKAGSQGSFRLPERVGVKGGIVKGTFYRRFRLTTADEASAGAVREALANDLTRLLGVPAQELSLVRGEYSDGHPKLMLTAKFANGYKDLENGFLRDGQAVAPPGATPLEPLGKYKALFLALADRDAVGSHGQNKGIVDGHFFAIDPGHSLEGNGRDLEIHDDLSFRDKNAGVFEKRFRNFSVFDDDTRFAKFEGVLKLRELVAPGSTKLNDLFTSYKAKFNPLEPGISDAERKLRGAILSNIADMEAEFRTQIGTILHVFASQLILYDALQPQGDDVQRGAIESLSNLEKLTSPTTWKSPHGEVELRHLAIEPGKRVPWEARLDEAGNLVYTTKGPLTEETKSYLFACCTVASIRLPQYARGGATITVPPEKREAFFEAFSEKNIAEMTHLQEFEERDSRRDGIQL